MITNFETDVVCLALGLTNPIYREASTNLVNALHKNDIPLRMLPLTESTCHIWARDYMPVQVTKQKFVLFLYKPDYLRDNPEYIPDTTAILDELGINPLNVIESDIILDGGNVISCGDKVILTDKIFKENPHYTRDALVEKISDLLEAEPVFIPWDKYEEYGHSDGMVRYLGDGRVLLNNYCDFDKSFRNKLLAALSPHFEVIELHYGSYTANSWAYLNFLHVGSHIYVPMLSEKLDEIAFKQIAEAFPSCQCHKIFKMEHIVKDGGALNCISWNISKIKTRNNMPFYRSGKTIYLANMVQNFYHDADGIYAFNSKGDRTEIFLRQGELCNASATYSFMMMLILNQKLIKDDFAIRYQSNGNDFVDKIRSAFLRSLTGNGRIIEYIESIGKKLIKGEYDIDVEVHTTMHGVKNRITRHQLGSFIENHLSQKRPVQISCYAIESQINHSLVVIGYNKIEPDTLLLYCLDPSTPLEKHQLSNCTVEFNYRIDHYDKIHHYDGSENWADVGEALVIIPDNPLFEYPF